MNSRQAHRPARAALWPDRRTRVRRLPRRSAALRRRVCAAFTYAYPVDALIQALKYGGQLALAGWFAHKLQQRIGDAAGVDLIVPLPLHPARLAERGFNQAAEIAKALSRLSGIAMDAGLARRVRNTAPQTDLPWREREANMRQAFSCEHDLAGLSIAVIDNVMTTGATLNEFARTLKKSGAAREENFGSRTDTRDVSRRALPARNSAQYRQHHPPGRQHRRHLASGRAAGLPTGGPRTEARRPRLSRVCEPDRAQGLGAACAHLAAGASSPSPRAPARLYRSRIPRRRCVAIRAGDTRPAAGRFSTACRRNSACACRCFPATAV